jgi:hypothetical protein
MSDEAPPAFHWQLTLRTAGETSPVEQILVDSIVPLLQAGQACRTALAACIHCAGELTVMADWTAVEDLELVEANEAFRSAIAALESHLRVAPKREVWRLLLSA